MRKWFTLENPWWFWISATLVGTALVGIVWFVLNLAVR